MTISVTGPPHSRYHSVSGFHHREIWMSSTVDCPTVFISYSSLDKHLARRIARRLLHSGAQVIIDEVDLRPGLILAAELQRQIARSTHLIVIWTEASADSPWVAKEIEFACAIPEPP